MDTESWPEEDELSELSYKELVEHAEEVQQASEMFSERHDERTDDEDDIFASLACRLRGELIREEFSRRERSREGEIVADDVVLSDALDGSETMNLDEWR